MMILSANCLNCKTEFEFKRTKRGRSYCSKRCASLSNQAKTVSPEAKKKRELTNFKNTGYTNPFKSPESREKGKDTFLKRTGKTHYMEVPEIRERYEANCLAKGYETGYAISSKTVRDKQKLTNIEKYGVDNVSKSDVIKDKRKKTFLERTGYESSFSNPMVRGKSIQTLMERSGVVNPMLIGKSKVWLDTFSSTDEMNKIVAMNRNECLTAEEISIKYGVSAAAVVRFFKRNNIPMKRFKISRQEKELADFISSISDTRIIISDTVTLKGKEIDILLPDYKLGVELNGIFYHSQEAGNKVHDYHLNKTDKSKLSEIRLIHLWDSEWNGKKDICKSIISNLLGRSVKIPARACEIKEISSKDSREFLDGNHLQGSVNSSIRYGLYHQGRLVSLMTFSKNRFSKGATWELTRFCNKTMHSTIGGASRLLSHFRKNHKGDIISYADRRISLGGMYYSLGFELISVSKPNYFYTSDYKKLESRVKYQKHKLKILLDSFDEDKTEWENMKSHGYDRVFDCGNLVFKLKN